jgi:hypothetical protein
VRPDVENDGGETSSVGGPMISQETDILLSSLAKIEAALCKVYEQLSKNEHFSGPVRKFWASISDEELLHAKIFTGIRERAMADSSVLVHLLIDRPQLESFVEKGKALLKTVINKNISESEAYTLASQIETELDEAAFLQRITINDPNFAKRLKQVENETKRHRVILVNYARGIK